MWDLGMTMKYKEEMGGKPVERSTLSVFYVLSPCKWIRYEFLRQYRALKCVLRPLVCFSSLQLLQIFPLTISFREQFVLSVCSRRKSTHTRTRQHTRQHTHIHTRAAVWSAPIRILCRSTRRSSSAVVVLVVVVIVVVVVVRMALPTQTVLVLL